MKDTPSTNIADVVGKSIIETLDDKHIEICGIKLPSDERVFYALTILQKAEDEDLEKIKRFLFAAVGRFREAITEFRNLEFKEDPEILADHLEELHLYGGGLKGLADAMYRKIQGEIASRLYEENKETKRGEGLTQQDRKDHVKYATADLEGLVSLISQMQLNLHERWDTQKGKMYRRR